MCTVHVSEKDTDSKLKEEKENSMSFHKITIRNKHDKAELESALTTLENTRKKIQAQLNKVLKKNG